MKARYRYRIYPTDAQQLLLSKLFGCVRVVWNDAVAHCKTEYQAGNKKPSGGDLQKLFITQAKKTIEREWLSEVSNIPLQQSLNDLEQAYQNFFKSCKKERKGKPVRSPKFKKRRAAQSARFRKGGWRQFRTFLEGKAEKYGREFRVISRWEPTSQTCSCCGFRGGKLDLSIREWTCLNCEAIHDRDKNAATNIKVAGGHSEAQNGRGGKRQTIAKLAASCEASTCQEFIQLSLFD